MRRMKRRRTRGQAIVELSLAMPVLVLLGLGASDFGRAYFYRLPVSSAASAGARTGMVSNTADIGLAVRTQSSAMPNTAAIWGTLYGASGSPATSDCSNSQVSSQSCGDAAGCASSSSFWTSPPSGQPNPVACYAVRSCTVDTRSASAHTGQCTAPSPCTAVSAWKTRPTAQAALAVPPCLGALQVTVVYRYQPITPLIGAFFSGPGHALFITSTVTVVEEY
jgi:Flp pilus assembly protein TadG